MKKAQAGQQEYEARARRVQTLISAHPGATEILTFYGEILAFQKTLAAQIAREARNHIFGKIRAGIRGDLSLALILPHFRRFLGIVEARAPAALAQAARNLAELPSDAWVALLNGYWEFGGRCDQQIGVFAQFFPRALLQPFAELAANQDSLPLAAGTSSVCPVCDGRPLLGLLRQEGDGGRRFLLCSFCSTEWDFRRILCPFCGEEDEKKLPVYVAEQFEHIRVECCDTCKFYLRTIDLTKDGHAVPLVDDLAAIPLTLWAYEHGYSRVQPNLLGT